MTENENTTGALASDELKDAVLEGAAEEAAEQAAAQEAGAESPEAKGERLGEALEAERAEAAAAAATPAGQASERKKHVGVIVAVVAFAVLLVGAGIAYSVLAPTAADEAPEVTGMDAVHTTEVETGDTTDGADSPTMEAPNFTMTDADGATLQLSDFRGKPVLLNFWASWCGPCASEMPDIQASWETNGEDVQFVIVNMTGMSGETETTAKAFLSENGYTFPAYFDKNSSAQAAFGVSSIPQTYLIDAEGNIIGGYMGAMTSSVLAEGISMLTASAQ